jgi:hypothetical protein
METYSVRHLVAGPTLLSLARLPLGVAFVFALGHGPWPWIALVASAVTDVLDGWYARRTGQVTKTGAMVDGVMDKVFVLLVVLALVVMRALLGVVAHEVSAAPAHSIVLEPTVSDTPAPELRARADDGVRAFLMPAAEPEIVPEQDPTANRAHTSPS